MFPSMQQAGVALPPTAPYPQSGYPATAFFGGSLASASPGANAAPATPSGPGEVTRTLLIIGALVVGGYIVFHLNYNRK